MLSGWRRLNGAHRIDQTCFQSRMLLQVEPLGLPAIRLILVDRSEIGFLSHCLPSPFSMTEASGSQVEFVPLGSYLAQGATLTDFTGETLLGHVGDQDVLLVRSGAEIFAIDAHCSHYHGPLARGLVVGESIRCPWHHACFDLRSGEATRAPALSALAVWQVEHEGSRIFVRQKREQPKPRRKGAVEPPGKIVIVGGGAAGFAAAEMLRRQA